MRSYESKISSNFIFTRGNGNIYNAVNSLVSKPDEILVYLDTVPGNDSTRKIYNKLASLSRKNNKKIIILPIIGLEYYFIKSIQHENVVKLQAEVDTCVARRQYFTSRLLVGQREKDYCKSYERFCKLILMKAVMDCVRNSEDYGKNTYFRWYYEKDCKCSKSFNECADKTVIDKSTALLAAYPCVPANSVLHNMKSLNAQDIWDIHRTLVDEHNKLCAELKQYEPNVAKKNLYKNISII